MAYTVLNFDFRVKTLIPGVERRISELFAPFRRDGDAADHEFFVSQAEGRRFEVALDGTIAHRSQRLDSAIDWVLWKASTEAIAGVRDHLAIHAGAVSWRGRGILLPAPPDSGKTTLTAALTAAGLDYYSDEAALIDPSTALLVPFPRALWLEEGSVAALARFLARDGGETVRVDGTSHVAPSGLRGRIGEPCAVGFIIFPRYTPGSETTLTPVARAASLVELGRHVFNLEAFGADGLRVLAGLVRGAETYRLSMGDLESAVDAVEALIGVRSGSGALCVTS